jgi:hypothetical protein
MIKAYVGVRGSSSKIVLLGFSQGGKFTTDVLTGGVLKPDILARKRVIPCFGPIVLTLVRCASGADSDVDGWNRGVESRPGSNGLYRFVGIEVGVISHG